MLLLLFVGIPSIADAQSSGVSASGTVYSAETGETLPFVQIYFVTTNSRGDTIPTTIGTTSDLDGVFSISSSAAYTTVVFQMVGFKPYKLSLRAGKPQKGLRIKLAPDVYTLSDVVIKPPKKKEKYKRKGNPAVELVRNVIAYRDSFTVKGEDHYTANTYSRMSFALDNFYPNFSKPFWKTFAFAEKYIDTTGTYPSVTVSIREYLSNEYYQRSPRRDRKVADKKRIFGLEDVIGSEMVQDKINSVFQDPDINVDNMELLYNRFVSPISSSLAVSYYKYYIMDTIQVDGYECIDLAFVPVNSESYSFTGHLYIVNDSTFKIKRYAMNIPPDINLNFVTDYIIEHNYRQLENGLWAPDRTITSAKFSVFKKKHSILARQTKLYTDWDFDTPLDPTIVNTPQYETLLTDSGAQRLASELWDDLRPEPLTKYESSVCDLVSEFTSNKKFATLALTANALFNEYIPTQPARKMDRSKFDIGPIYNTVSWNMLEGVRLRVGGVSTPKLHDQFFFRGYVAFGTTDLKPKYNLSLMYSFVEKKKKSFEPLRDCIQLIAQYDVEEPGQAADVIPRDNIIMSIPTSKPKLGNNQYVFHAKLDYMKEWEIGLGLRANFDFTNNKAAGIMTYDRILGYSDKVYTATENVRDYNTYTTTLELIYSPGTPTYIRPTGQMSPFALDKDDPVITLSHKFGYLDDRYTGGCGFFINRTELTADKRFWLSSFGHIDLRLQGGVIWNKVPFTELYIPKSSTSIILAHRAFNQMQPMEFLMDKYVALYCTYYLKGWILNRIPGINKLKLRGVISFSGIYGGLSNKNNPYEEGCEGLYKFPESAQYDPETNEYLSGNTCSPIDYKLPYMECSFGLENIFKLLRVDYIRRLTYNEYYLPDGIHTRKIGAWGRNGVKVTIRFSL